MKIGLLNTCGAVIGGVERLLHDVSLELRRRGTEVFLIFANDDRAHPHQEQWPEAIRRYYVHDPIQPLTGSHEYGELAQRTGYRRALQHIIDVERPDILHLHNFPSSRALSGILTDAPIFKTFHSYETLCENFIKSLPDGSICGHAFGDACRTYCGFPEGLRRQWMTAENRFLHSRAARVIAVSDYVRGVLIQNGFAAPQIRVLPNSTGFTPGSGHPPNGPDNLVAFAGRIAPEKGLLELLDAIGRTRSRPKLVVLGASAVLSQDPYLVRVLNEAARLDITVEVHDWGSRECVRQTFERARLVAVPSAAPEPFGIVGIEAMMTGRPVVAFDCGAIREWLIDGETGFVVPHRDVGAMADRIDVLLSNDTLRQTMGQRARQIACRQFSTGGHVDRLLDIYDEVRRERAGSLTPFSRRGKTLAVVGPFHGPTGYDRHVRHFVRRLAARDVSIQLIDLPEWSAVRLDRSQQDPWFDTLDQPVNPDTVLHFSMPHQVVAYGGKRNTNFTMFEATRIHPHWVDHHRQHNMVIVPTDACRRAWIESGVPQDKMELCPLGVDAERYRPGNEPLDLVDRHGRRIADYRVRVLNISEIGARKNLLALLRVWILVTRSMDDAILILKLGSYQPGWSVKFMLALSMMERTLGKSRQDCAPIFFTDRIFSDEDMPGLFAAATHYWSMSHGEAWDQPMMEAGASGLRLIAPKHSAYETYLDDTVARMIPSREGPADFPGGGEFPELFKGANWWTPDEDVAGQYLTHAVRGGDDDHPRAAERIRSEYTWDKATERLMTLLFP